MSNLFSILLLIVVSIFASLGQLCFKKSSLLKMSLWKKLRSPVLLLGLFFFGSCTVMSSIAAKVLDYSIIYSMTALNYVFVLLLSRLVLKEIIDWPKIVGVFIIILGLIVIVTA